MWYIRRFTQRLPKRIFLIFAYLRARKFSAYANLRRNLRIGECVYLYYSQTFEGENMVHTQIYATANYRTIRKNSHMRKHAESANKRKDNLRILEIFACEKIAKIPVNLKNTHLYAHFRMTKISYFVQCLVPKMNSGFESCQPQNSLYFPWTPPPSFFCLKKYS